MTLTWSISRDKTLDACERRYYFEYLAGARMNSRDSRLGQIAHLKKLKPAFIWQGEVFHSLAANLLRKAAALGDVGVVDAKRLADSAIAQMERDWQDALAARLVRASIQAESPVQQVVLQASLFGGEEAISTTTKRSRSGASPRQSEVPNEPASLALFEHEYHDRVDDGVLAESVATVRQWFERFYCWVAENRVGAELRNAKRAWIEPEVFGPRAPGFAVRDTHVLAKVDLALQRRDGRFLIFDWKTGAVRTSTSPAYDEDAEYQVTVYGLWAHRTLGVALDAIEARVVFVAAAPIAVRSYTFDADTCERAWRRVGAAIKRARALADGVDAGVLQEKDFNFARHPAMCRWCGFKQLCWEECSA